MYQLTGEGWRGWGGEEDTGLERWGDLILADAPTFPRTNTSCPHFTKHLDHSGTYWGVGVSENPAKSLYGTEYRRPMGMG
jgi:hypothetical protein